MPATKRQQKSNNQDRRQEGYGFQKSRCGKGFGLRMQDRGRVQVSCRQETDEGHRQIRCRLGEPVVHPRARGRSRLECGSSHAVRRRRRVALGTSCCERQCDIQSPRKRFRMERWRRLRSRCGRHHHLPPEFLIFPHKTEAKNGCAFRWAHPSFYKPANNKWCEASAGRQCRFH